MLNDKRLNENWLGFSDRSIYPILQSHLHPFFGYRTHITQTIFKLLQDDVTDNIDWEYILLKLCTASFGIRSLVVQETFLALDCIVTCEQNRKQITCQIPHPLWKKKKSLGIRKHNKGNNVNFQISFSADKSSIHPKCPIQDQLSSDIIHLKIQPNSYFTKITTSPSKI